MGDQRCTTNKRNKDFLGINGDEYLDGDQSQAAFVTHSITQFTELYKV